MGARGTNCILQYVRQAALAGLTDRELLDALIARRDEAAFEALLRRHGPMVLAICRQVLRNPHDAEDAFQATFLVLIRKATTIRKREAIGSWLCGVASRTARKARAINARRHAKEMQAAMRPRPETAEPDADLEVELNALPEKYRVPLVLCELEGRSRKEVARELNIPEGTLSSRLAAARKILARRLRRRGCPFAGAVPVAVSAPVRLLTATVKAAGPALAGREMTGVVSAKVIVLTEGTLKAMFATKVKALTTALIVLGALGFGSLPIAYLALAEGAAASAQERPQRKDEAQQAAAELAAASAALKQAEAKYHAARQRHARLSGKVEAGAGALALAARFKYRIKVETGWTENKDGGRIDILEVWGTRPKIEVGGQYLVRGKYKLPAHEKGTLYFYETSTGNWNNTGPNLDLQYTAVKKGQGEFTLVHGMGGPGYFHLELRGANREQDVRVANVYFGTGDNVLRKKP